MRYKRPNEKQSLLIERGIAASAKPLDKASVDTRFALAVAAYGQQLRGGRYNGTMQWPVIIALARANTGSDRYGLRKEFVRLAETARNLSSSRP